jgi:hypothetical protein
MTFSVLNWRYKHFKHANHSDEFGAYQTYELNGMGVI